MTIRTAVDDDHVSIDLVVRIAFDRVDEASLVERIRASAQYVPDLDLVACADDRIVGHVLLSRIWLGERGVLGLAPLSVLPSYQGRGIGTALVNEALARADAMGEPIVLVLGDPGYYGRFGFELATDWGIDPPPGFPPHAFQAKPLSAYDPFARGRCRYPEAFDTVS